MMGLRRKVLSVGLLLFLRSGLLLPARAGFQEQRWAHEQPERTKFYALRVVSDNKVQNAKDSLGAPDGRSAEILPGGQLVVLMQNLLLPSLVSGYGENAGCVDSGSVAGKGEKDFGLEGRFKWQDSQGEQHYEWILLGLTATGFCISPPASVVRSLMDGPGVDLVRITNAGIKSLFVDAVIGYTGTYQDKKQEQNAAPPPRQSIREEKLALTTSWANAPRCCRRTRGPWT